MKLIYKEKVEREAAGKIYWWLLSNQTKMLAYVLAEDVSGSEITEVTIGQEKQATVVTKC